MVVASSNTSAAVRAFLWTLGSGVKDLGTLPADTGSEAFGINRRRQAVGYCSGPGGIQAVLLAPDGSVQPLGKLPGGKASEGFAINEPGDVVGMSGTPQRPHTYLWTQGGGMQDLNSLIGAGSGLVVAEAIGINDLGVILAIGYDQHDADAHEGVEHLHELPLRILLLVPGP